MNFSCVSYTNVVFNLSVPQVCIKVRLCVFSHLLKNEHVLKKSQKSATTAKRLIEEQDQLANQKNYINNSR
jgi:hypothetical protein